MAKSRPSRRELKRLIGDLRFEIEQLKERVNILESRPVPPSGPFGPWPQPWQPTWNPNIPQIWCSSNELTEQTIQELVQLRHEAMASSVSPTD